MISKVIVKGERCSGTNYLRTLINLNFKSVTTENILGWKHSYLNVFNEEIFGSDNFLVLIISRNPYEWVNSLYNNPWHLSGTNGDKFILPISFSEFIRYEPYNIDEYDYEKFIGLSGVRYIERHPFTLEYPKNVFELRNWKNENFLNHSKILRNVLYIKYEDLYESPKKILDVINENYIHEEYDFVDERLYKGDEYAGVFEKKIYPKMSDDDFNFFIESIDWNIEEKIGYSKDDMFIFHNNLSQFDLIEE